MPKVHLTLDVKAEISQADLEMILKAQKENDRDTLSEVLLSSDHYNIKVQQLHHAAKVDVKWS